VHQNLCYLGGITWWCRRGLLTPGLTIGALLGSLLFIVLGRLFPGSDMAGFALTGAAGFLSASMQMPVTAITLMMEFTRMDHSF
jgi:H+/Cl- antiporter ClcA